jgi:hypothetical protein
MAAKYKFACKSCGYECISSIGTEIGPHSSEVAMVCSSCTAIDSYTFTSPGNGSKELSSSPVCKDCGSGDHLGPWDGLTCPHCKNHMRASGNPIGAKRAIRQW